MQKRIGKDGKRFGLLKFATMLKDSPNMNLGTVTVKDDPRVLIFSNHSVSSLKAQFLR